MSRFHTHDWDMLPEQAFRPRGGKFGPMTLEGGGKGGSSAPPPDPALIAAQIRSMGIQDSAITKMMQNADTMAPLQKEQMQFGLDTSRVAYDQAQEDRTWALGRRGMLTDAQDDFSKKVDEFDTEANRDQMADIASADVDSAYSSAREQQARGLSRMGINPSSGRALAMGNQTAIAQAAAKSGAANKVRMAAIEMGFQLQGQKANMLSGYPTMASGLTGSGAGFGAAGLTTANAGLNGLNAGLTSVTNGAGQMGSNATGMYGAQASYKNSQDQIAASNDPWNSILGAATGVGMSYALKSDRRLKTDIMRVGRLDNGLRVYSYRYKTGGPFMIGVMADEVASVVPEAYIKGGAGNGYDAVDYSKL